ncbi:olfactory receptor 1468-like [Pseudophryne corroboree]|uniref:olfactory receptor 1468-like n=1 Tax=Pseudophryne corroboree TaxID=495146 RepID=UPI003081549A
MHQANVTTITTIYLLGLQIPQSVTFLVFFLLFTVYFMTICGNLLIIVLVSHSKNLHSPMYFFLTHLSLSDILMATDILPSMLHAAMVKPNKISFTDCITQFYFFDVSETSECLLLTVMSYDRYLAICKPLHYHSLINTQLCLKMVIVTWILSFSVVLIHTLTITKLQFCGPDIIDHFFCDLAPLLELSCSDTSLVQLEVTCLSALLVVIPFLIIIISYVYIIAAILQIPSITGRQKAFSTCSSHLAVVSMYYGTLVCVYLVPDRRYSWKISKVLSLLYTVVTPLMNPIIYSLRNKELKKAVHKILNKLHDAPQCLGVGKLGDILYI